MQLVNKQHAVVVVAGVAAVAVVVVDAVVHGHGKFMHNFSRFQKIFASLIVAQSSPHGGIAFFLLLLLFSSRRCLRLKLPQLQPQPQQLQLQQPHQLHWHAGAGVVTTLLKCFVKFAARTMWHLPFAAAERVGGRERERRRRGLCAAGESFTLFTL